MMSALDFIDIPSSPASIFAYSIVGLGLLSFLYGIFGILLTIVQFIVVGKKRFFKRVDRPKPPVKAMDPIYGKHEMIKLNVIYFDFNFKNMKKFDF